MSIPTTRPSASKSITRPSAISLGIYVGPRVQIDVKRVGLGIVMQFHSLLLLAFRFAGSWNPEASRLVGETAEHVPAVLVDLFFRGTQAILLE